MKFFTAAVALAGVSSTHATLRGVLPADMKELLNNKFEFAASASHSADALTCSQFTDGSQHCTSTDECNNRWSDQGDGGYCEMTCNEEPNPEASSDEEWMQVCRLKGNTANAADMKELLNNKFEFAASASHSADALTCSQFTDGSQRCTSTDECNNGWSDQGDGGYCEMTCNQEPNPEPSSDEEWMQVCRLKGNTANVEDEDMVATCDICHALNTNAIQCENTNQCQSYYSKVNAGHCSVSCDYQRDSDGNMSDEKYCIQGSDEVVDATN